MSGWDLAGGYARGDDDAGNRMSACPRGSVVVYARRAPIYERKPA